MWPSMMHESVESMRSYRMFFLLLLCCWTLLEVVAGASEDESTSRATIPVDPAAAAAFPSAQFSSACGIIAIEGLGSLDGDYTLVDELMEMDGIPAWIGTSVDTRNFLLSWQMNERVWTIGKYGLSVYRAFVGGAPDVPPSTSSRWQLYTRSMSAFEEVDHAVSITCPGKLPIRHTVLDIKINNVLYTFYYQTGPYIYAHDGTRYQDTRYEVPDTRCIMVLRTSDTTSRTAGPPAQSTVHGGNHHHAKTSERLQHVCLVGYCPQLSIKRKRTVELLVVRYDNMGIGTKRFVRVMRIIVFFLGRPWAHPWNPKGNRAILC